MANQDFKKYLLYEVEDGIVRDWDGEHLPESEFGNLQVGDKVRLILTEINGPMWEKIYFQILKIEGVTFYGEAKPYYRMIYPREFVNDGDRIYFKRTNIIEIPLMWKYHGTPLNEKTQGELLETELGPLLRLQNVFTSPLNPMSDENDIEGGAFGYYSEMGHIIHLGINLEGVKEFPIEVFELNHLKLLNIYGFNFSEIPEEITTLIHLEHLVLWACNTPMVLPDSIGKIKNLKSLRLVRCNLQSLPPSFSHLMQLKKIHIAGANFQILPPQLCNLPNLKELHIVLGHMESLPPDIGRMDSLEILDLASNELSSIPVSIGNLSNLKELILDRNKLVSIPDTLENLRKLRSLGLSENNFNTFPSVITKLENLKELYLSENKISSIPKEIGKLGNLEDLFLDDNLIVTLPEEITQLEELNYLNIKNNRLQELPNGLETLQNLDKCKLSGNPLVKIPKRFLDSFIRELNLRDEYIRVNPGDKPGELRVDTGKKQEDGTIEWDEGRSTRD